MAVSVILKSAEIIPLVDHPQSYKCIYQKTYEFFGLEKKLEEVEAAKLADSLYNNILAELPTLLPALSEIKKPEIKVIGNMFRYNIEGKNCIIKVYPDKTTLFLALTEGTELGDSLDRVISSSLEKYFLQSKIWR